MSFGRPQAPLTPEQMQRQQRLGLGLSALSDVFARRDPIAGTMQRQAVLKQQQMQAERDKLNKELNAAIDNSNIPKTQKTFIKAMGIKEKYDALYGQKAPKREYTEDVRGVKRYIDTQERVFPGVEIPQDKTDMTETERMQAAYNELMKKPVEGRDEEDKRNIAIYENELFGQPRVIPFYDNQGNVVESITSRDLIFNPNIIKEKEEQGLFTVGQSPSTTPKGAKSAMTLVRDDYLGAKSQIDTINDLASIVEQNKDAFTLAGGLVNLVNSTKYQIQSAERLANLDKLQQNEKEFTELDNMLDSKYGDILDKISQDRAVAKSIFLRLAYGTAKEIDPSGRLSDNDVKIAMDIIGNLGANWKANLATLESLANRTQREYADKYKVRIGRVGDEDLQEANKYETIPQFLGGRDWRQSMPTIGTQTPPNIQSLLNKYPPQG
jgi:hypothetical protein